MRILIVEDEPLVAQRLQREVVAFFGERVHLVAHCEMLADAHIFVQKERVDLVLLDLNLRGEDGFKLLETLGRAPFNTIVVSGHVERALTAFEVGVLDFVAKPFSQARLTQAFHRHIDSIGNPRARKLLVRRLGDIELVQFSAISHASADGHYAELMLVDGSTRFYDQSLDRLLDALGSDFMRVHRSYAVNLKHVVRLTIEAGGRYGLDTQFARAIPVSRSLYPAVKAAVTDAY